MYKHILSVTKLPALATDDNENPWADGYVSKAEWYHIFGDVGRAIAQIMVVKQTPPTVPF